MLLNRHYAFKSSMGSSSVSYMFVKRSWSTGIRRARPVVVRVSLAMENVDVYYSKSIGCI